MPETLHYKVGDRFVETTLGTGTHRYWTVVEVNAEPKYPQESDRPYLRLKDVTGREMWIGQRIIDSVDWIVPLPDDTEQGS